MGISWNLPFSYHGEHIRKHEQSECLESLYATRAPSDVPLFQSRAAGIEKWFRRNGYDYPLDRNPMDVSWDYLKARPYTVKAEDKFSYARFLGSLKAAQTYTPWWEVDEFERTYLALETDSLGKSKKTKIKESVAETAEEKGAPTGPGVATVQDRLELNACSSAVAHSALMLGKSEHQRICGAVSSVCASMISYYASNARESRCHEGCSKWLKEKLNGGWMEFLKGFLTSTHYQKQLVRVHV